MRDYGQYQADKDAGHDVTTRGLTELTIGRMPASVCRRIEWESEMKQIAIYGKGSIGKSTIATHLSYAIANRGKRVLQIGCDPQSDSTHNLTAGHIKPILTVLGEKP